MSENLKTIKELADELGVSKKKIHYQVSKLDSNLIQRLDGTIYLNNVAIKVIKGNIGYVPKTKLDSVGVRNRQYLDTKLDTVNTSLIDEKNEWFKIPNSLSSYRELPNEFIIVPKQNISNAFTNTPIQLTLKNIYVKTI